MRELAFRELHFANRISNNSFGEVWLGGWHGAPVAIKRLKQRHMTRAELAAVKEELMLHQTLRNPYIVQLIGACTVQPAMCLITEFAQHGSLEEFVQEAKQDIPLRLRLAFLHDIARGMSFLHHCGIVHGRLKSSNLLLFENKRVRVADFGLAQLTATKLEVALSEEPHPVGSSSRWMSPELLLAQPRHSSARTDLAGSEDEELLNPPSSKTDVFSFAMVIYQLWIRKAPFFNILRENDVEAVILRGDRPVLSSAAERQCPPVNAIMERCWEKRPSQRPEFGSLAGEIDKLLTAEGRDPRPLTETKISDLRVAIEQVKARYGTGDDGSAEAAQPGEEKVTTADGEAKRREASTAGTGLHHVVFAL